nr:MAG TPA: hypothetical protein [Caudoviricetes sp.]
MLSEVGRKILPRIQQDVKNFFQKIFYRDHVPHSYYCPAIGNAPTSHFKPV